ncbi:inorganic phosphate transporter 1-4-like protein [Tanacetum coccineum]
MAREQLQVLSALDSAKTQLYHFTAIVIAVTGVALVGTLCGQLFFGWLGDKMGRKKVYGMTLAVMVVCSFASGLSFGNEAKGVMATLCFFRFWLGFGIGGDYPLSATIMSEYANKKTRGAFIADVFLLAKVWEFWLAPQADYIWRIILMFGAIPAALTYYWRMKMPETARYTALVAKNAKQAAQDMARVLQVEIEAEEHKVEEIAADKSNSFGLFSREFLRRHGLHLLGTTYHRRVFVGMIEFTHKNLFQKDVFTAIGWIPAAAKMSATGEVFKVAKAQTLIDFAVLSHGFAEIFPARLRSTCHGISAAAGKAGAIVGAYGFLYASQSTDPHKTDKGYPTGIGIRYSLIALGIINFLGMAFTFLVPEPNGKSLEELSGENEEVTEPTGGSVAPA